MQKKITSILSIFLCIFLSFHCFINNCISYENEAKSHDCCGSDSDHDQKEKSKCDTSCKKVITLESSKIKFTADNFQISNYPIAQIFNVVLLYSNSGLYNLLPKMSSKQPPNQQLILTRNIIESIAPPRLA